MSTPVDQITSLLMESEAPEEVKEEVEELEAEEQETPEPVEATDEESESEDQPEEASEEEEITWGKVLAVDESKLVLDEEGNFKGVTVKVDGIESQVDLNTLIAGYQTAKSTTQKSQALAEERRAFQSQVEQARNAYASKIAELDQMSELVERKFMSDVERIDINRLRVENPAEYSALMVDLNNRRADIEKMRAAIRQTQAQVASQAEIELQQKRDEYIRSEVNKTVERYPELGDPAVSQKVFSEMRAVARQYGYNDEEFDQLADSRAIAVLYDLVKSNSVKQEVSKKVMKPVPKFVSATKQRTSKPTASKLDRLIRKANTATGSHKRIAQTDAIAELLLSQK